MFRRLWSRWLSRRNPHRSIGEESQSEFFSWFHLKPVASLQEVEGGFWHAFRPAGLSFHDRVCVEIRTDEHGIIVESVLGLERSFIGGPDAAFARDIAKSFLRWALSGPAASEAESLIANISDLQGAGSVLMRGHSLPPPLDTSGLYAIFLGSHEHGETRFAGMQTGMTNLPGAMPAAYLFQASVEPGPALWGWLKISVRQLD